MYSSHNIISGCVRATQNFSSCGIVTICSGKDLQKWSKEGKLVDPVTRSGVAVAHWQTVQFDRRTTVAQIVKKGIVSPG